MTTGGVSHPNPRDVDGPIGPVYNQVVRDIWKQIPSRDADNYYVLTNRVLRKFLADPRLVDVLVESGVLHIEYRTSVGRKTRQEQRIVGEWQPT